MRQFLIILLSMFSFHCLGNELVAVKESFAEFFGPPPERPIPLSTSIASYTSLPLKELYLFIRDLNVEWEYQFNYSLSDYKKKTTL